MQVNPASLFIMNSKLQNLSISLLKPLLAFAFPASCAVCSTLLSSDEHIICNSCKNRLQPLSGQILNRLKEEIQPAAFDDLFVALEFGPVFQHLIHLLKYQRYLSLAGFFAAQLYPILNNAYNIIAPVPLNRNRQRERGYNQSALIVKHLAGLSGWHFDTDLLTRLRNTPSQTKLNRAERKENMRNAFVCKKNVSGLSVLLVDDVITTGSTLNTCAEEVKKSGAARVDIAAIATPVDFFQNELEVRSSESEILDIHT